MFELQGKTALVTGATRGIGRAVALALAGAGADVAITGRDVALLAEVRAEIERAGARGFVVEADLLDIVEIATLIETVERDFAPLDILVNNAGANQVEPSFEVSPDTWDRIIDVNLRAPFFAAREAARRMAQRGSGKVINISSEAGINGLAGHAAYGASKGGLITLTRDLAVEWAPLGIQVNAVCPGPTWTDMTSPAMEDPATAAEIIARGVAGRISSPQEIAAAVVYLASSEADMVIGQALSVDGGSTAK